MKLFESKHLIALLGLSALIFSGCASGGSKPEAQQTAQQIDAPQTASGPDKNLYSQALKAQNAGQFESAIKLWKDFLSNNPDSYEGHNNLGLVYYTQDMLEQALQEFETAYRLEPTDPRIRQNLARTLRFKAAMVHESRDYFKTLKILARLENIVEPEEKQAILFKQEQVEDQIFLQVIKANNSASYQEFVNRFPDGLNAVRAREYLKKHPHHASKSTSSDKVFKSSSKSKGKSWISGGKVNKDPDGVIKPWASSEQPPDYASRPTATYTPPPAGVKKKKSGDFFGTDSAAIEKVAEDNGASAQAMDPTAAIPFEDFEKPERSSEQAAEKESNGGKGSLRVADEFDSMGDEPNTESAGLDTLPDLKPSPVATLPEEVEAPQSADTATGDIKMQPAEQEPEETLTASVEEHVKEAVEEEAKQEAPEAESTESANETMARILKEEIPPEAVQEPAQEAETQPTPAEENSLEVAGSSESVESESDRIARIVREEIANSENEGSDQAQPEAVQEPAQEAETQPTPAEENSLEVAGSSESVESESDRIARAVREEISNEMAADPEPSQEEAPLEVASIDPENQQTEQESVPAESPPVEETPSVIPDEKPEISQETVSETVAALIPTLPQETETVEPPAESVSPSSTMVVVQMRKGATLNVRAKPSSQGEILGYLENSDMMPFLSESGDWYQIEIEEGLSGWVSKKYSTTRDITAEVSSPAPKEDVMASELSSLEPEQPESSGAKEDAMVLVTVAEDSTLNVRSLPSPSGAVVDMLFGGDKLPLVKEENGWYQVLFEDETTGWISKKFSVIEGQAPTASQATVTEASLPVPVPKSKKAPWGVPVEKAEKEMVTTVIVIKVPEGSSLNVRSTPSSQGQVLGSLKRGDMRPLLEENDEWYQVELQNGQSGWVSQKFSGKMSLDSSFVESP
jgi:uncharacterized protein YgiM (DUF1202 family)/TolA-binding protein